ncbi:MAG: outer membrane protein transport protein [Candidatus Omnitrophica bacterium]|nr:outer membrane protein transport protein [Candidatus Omnitrophota bacterium]
MKSRPFSLLLVPFVLLFVFHQNSAWALGSAGFENASYSAESLAQSNAVVARPDDPDAVVFNAAGLPDLKGIQFSSSLAGLNTFTHLTSSATGDGEHNTPQLALIPTFFLTLNPGKLMGDKFGFGMGVTSPFGTHNRYHSIGNIAQYTGFRNVMKMVAVNIEGGVKLHEKLSIGGGAVSYSTYNYGQVLNFPNSFTLAGAVPGNTFPDGLARTEMRGFGWGWNVSALYKITPKQKLGFLYRSRATIDVHGNVKIEGLNALLAGTFPTVPTFQTGISSEIALPSNITVAYAYEPSEKWGAEFDLGYTRWSVFRDQDIHFDRPNTVLVSLGTIPKNSEDTWSFHLGGHYKANKKLDLMAGALLYTAAIPKHHFTNDIPDSNRVGGTFGFRYDLFKNATLDIAYLAMLYTRRAVDNPTVLAKSGLSIDGRYTSFTQEFLITFTYRFEDPMSFFKGKKKDDTKIIVSGPQAK